MTSGHLKAAPVGQAVPSRSRRRPRPVQTSAPPRLRPGNLRRPSSARSLSRSPWCRLSQDSFVELAVGPRDERSVPNSAPSPEPPRAHRPRLRGRRFRCTIELALGIGLCTRACQLQPKWSTEVLIGDCAPWSLVGEEYVCCGGPQTYTK